MAAICRLLKGRLPLPDSSPGRGKVLPLHLEASRLRSTAHPLCSLPSGGLHPHEPEPVGLAAHGQLGSEAEIHIPERSLHLLQGRLENQAAILGREGDEPVFQAQHTGGELLPYEAGRCRKFAIQARPPRLAVVPGIVS